MRIGRSYVKYGCFTAGDHWSPLQNQVRSVRKIGVNRCTEIMHKLLVNALFLRPVCRFRCRGDQWSPALYQLIRHDRERFPPHKRQFFCNRPFVAKNNPPDLSKGFEDSKGTFPKVPLAGFGAAPRASPRVPARPPARLTCTEAGAVEYPVAVKYTFEKTRKCGRLKKDGSRGKETDTKTALRHSPRGTRRGQYVGDNGEHAAASAGHRSGGKHRGRVSRKESVRRSVGISDPGRGHRHTRTGRARRVYSIRYVRRQPWA